MSTGPTASSHLTAISSDWHEPVRHPMSAELMLLAVAAIWGGSYALTKHVTLQVVVLHYLALRFGLTAVLLTPALLGERARALRPWGWGQALGLGALLLAIFVAETVGLTLTSATHAAFLISLCVAFTPLVEWVVLGRQPSAVVIAAVAMCITGAGLLSPGAFVQPSSNLGDALMLAAALLRAVMVTLTRRSAERVAMSAIALTAVQSWVVFLGSLAALAWFSPSLELPPLPVDVGFWSALLFLVLFCTIFAFCAQNHAASRLSPTRVSFLMGSEPVFGAVFGWLIFGDRLSSLAWLGCGLIWLSAYVVVLAPASGARAGVLAS